MITLNAHLKTQISMAVAEEYSVQEIADGLGMSYQCAAGRIRRLGLKARRPVRNRNRKKGWRETNFTQVMLTLLVDNKSTHEEVAAKNNCTREYVSQIGAFIRANRITIAT